LVAAGLLLTAACAVLPEVRRVAADDTLMVSAKAWPVLYLYDQLGRI